MAWIGGLTKTLRDLSGKKKATIQPSLQTCLELWFLYSFLGPKLGYCEGGDGVVGLMT